MVEQDVVPDGWSNLCGYFTVADSTEPRLFSGIYEDEVKRAIHSLTSSDGAYSSRLSDSLEDRLQSKEYELANAGRQSISLRSACDLLDDSLILFVTPVFNNIAIACLLPRKLGYDAITFHRMAMFNRGVAMFFKFDDNGGIVEWRADKIDFD
jgi:hypothetical protein